MPKLVTPKFRGSYVTLLRPKAIEDGDTPKYSITIVLPKNSKKTKAFIAELEAAMTEALTEKLGKPLPFSKCKHFPIIDGDEYEADHEEFLDSYVIRASSTRQPGILVKDEDGEKRPFESESEIYSGAWYHASVTVYAWSNKFGKGVSVGLSGVIKVADDEQYGGGSFSESDFDDV